MTRLEVDQRLVILFMLAVIGNLFWISLKVEQFAKNGKPRGKHAANLDAEIIEANKTGDYEKASDLFIRSLGLSNKTWPDFFNVLFHRS